MQSSVSTRVTEDKALVWAINDAPLPDMLLRPIADVDSIIDVYREYQCLKSRLLEESDYQVVRGKKYIKKSGFRKLSSAFNISTSITREFRLEFEGYFVYEITARAISTSGRYTEACASCASNEREFSHTDHDVRATAQTRATNRAIADLIGSGEVSAEEIGYADGKTNRETKSSSEYIDNNRESWPQSKVISEPIETDDEPITGKQRVLLLKLIETKYQDEKIRSWLFQRLNHLSKTEAWIAIQKMLYVPS